MAKQSTTPATPRLRFPEFREDTDWKPKTLGDVCRPQQWATISGSELSDIGFPVYGANGFIGYFSAYNHEFETVAVTCRGSTCGEVLLIPGKSYITGNSMCLDDIDAARNSYHFVYHYLKHRGFSDVISGSAQPQIVGNAIRRVRLAIPNIEEQQKIADCLTSLDEVIAAQGRKVEALKAHKRGLMQQLFPREGETRPRLRFPEFRDAPEWVTKDVGDVFRVTRGEVLAMPLVKDERSSETPYPVFSSQTKNQGLAGYYSEFLYEDAITWTTDGANAGDVNYRAGKFYCTNVCGVLLNSEGYANPCIAALLNAVTRSHVSYAGNPKLMNGVMAKIPVAFPSFEEQLRIADALSSLDDQITAESNQLAAFKIHKQGLMQQLFPNTSEK